MAGAWMRHGVKHAEAFGRILPMAVHCRKGKNVQEENRAAWSPEDGFARGQPVCLWCRFNDSNVWSDDRVQHNLRR